MTEPHRSASAPCDNCATVLQGGYCHVCGQRAHSPLQHVGHAIEEVFESFWHLDGRIFGTLRDLFVPGRVAAGYLAGFQRRTRALQLSVLGMPAVELGDSLSASGAPAQGLNASGTVTALRHRFGAREGFVTDLTLAVEEGA